MNSIRSTALEPTRHELAQLTFGEKIGRLVPVYGLLVLTLLLIALFTFLLPQSFPTMRNLNSILFDKSFVALLSLGVMIPMAAGRIDLTVGFGVGLWHILAIGLQTWYGVPWPIAALIVLALGVLMGVLNGLLVEVAQIDSFIATLGTGTVLYALSLLISGGRQVVGVLPETFHNLTYTKILGLPAPAYFVLALAVLLWVVLEYTPIGRYLYAVGASSKAAQLNGIPVSRYVMGAFVSSGLITAVAGVLLGSKLGIGQATVGPEFLLPALVGAFLGSTCIKPGRVNVWGTLVGVAILAVGISGIQQLGVPYGIEPLFNGVTLLVAIGIAGYAQRKRGAVIKIAPKPAAPLAQS
jgi:ribose transport system permease protein